MCDVAFLSINLPKTCHARTDGVSFSRNVNLVLNCICCPVLVIFPVLGVRHPAVPWTSLPVRVPVRLSESQLDTGRCFLMFLFLKCEYMNRDYITALWVDRTAINVLLCIMLRRRSTLCEYLAFFFLQKMEAAYYDNIMEQQRLEPEFFRVGFYGRKFPFFLRVSYYDIYMLFLFVMIVKIKLRDWFFNPLNYIAINYIVCIYL